VQISSFQQRIEQLKAFKEAHGHLRVTDTLDKKLAGFCRSTRHARRNPDRSMTEERIKALDDLGFEWNLRNHLSSFEDRIEQLKEFKEAHGHLRVAQTSDKNLAKF